MSRPLTDLRILDLTRLLPGPFATLLLADLGAQIIKIEAPPGGDYTRWLPPLIEGTSAVYRALNRDKLSVGLNLKHPDGPAILKRLIKTVDVVIESFRPGVMDRLGLGYSVLTQINPRLIYCSITGYGQTGPLAQRAGHDLNYMAIAGVLSVGRADEKIATPGVQSADIAGGALYGVIGILSALHERSRTGLGRQVDVSMTDGAAGLGLLLQAQQFQSQDPMKPGDDLLGGSRPSYRTYRCQDDKWLAVGALEPKFWIPLCQAIGRPDLASDGLATGARRIAVDAELESLFASQPRDSWVELLKTHDVCVEPVLDLKEARNTPHTKARGLFRTTTLASGADVLYPYPNPGLLPGAEPPAGIHAVGPIGADTHAVLRQVGYTPEDIDALAQSGAIVVPEAL